MRPEALLAGVAVAALVGTVALAAFVPGFVAEPDADEPPARLDVTETTLETGEITGETVTFDVTAFVTHRGGPAENVTVAVRAVDGSGVLAASETTESTTLEGGGERRMPVSITVPREGNYEVRTVLYVDGERADVARASVDGVGALTPPYADSSVAFAQLGQGPAVEYTIDAVDSGTATLGIRSYLTNAGDDPEDGIRIEVTARHAEAGVVADRTGADVGSIPPGRTASVDASVAVPDESNYYLDVTLWRDEVVLDSTRSAANLDPQRTVAVEERTEDVRFDAGEFETERAPQRPEPDAADAESQPGFGAAAAIAALIVGAVAARGRSK